jgi:hypothetical protein
MIKKEISYDDAIYQSHLIIEMIYDLAILNQINSFKTIDLLAEAVDFTAKNKMDQFVTTINWLYGVEKNEINEVMRNASIYITKDRLEQIMNIESRIHLYKDKFGLKSNDQLFYDSIKNLFQNARDLIDDDESFLRETAQIIKNYGWPPTFI